MTKTFDATAFFKDSLGKFPVDATAFQDAFKSSAAYGEKFSKLAIDAAEKSTEISTKWTRDTLNRLGEATKAKDEAADYSKAATDFATAQAELASQYLTAFGEVAKKLQIDTMELVMAAGKKAGEDTQAVVKKAQAEVAQAARKVGASAN